MESRFISSIYMSSDHVLDAALRGAASPDFGEQHVMKTWPVLNARVGFGILAER